MAGITLPAEFWSTLLPVECPYCRRVVNHVALCGGPSIVRHESRRFLNGERKRCRLRWVAIPRWSEGEAPRVELIECSSQNEALTLLRVQLHLWGQRFIDVVAQAAMAKHKRRLPNRKR